MLVDLLHASRTLRRSPASAGAAILTLALTLGAGASIFAVIDAVLLTPLPFVDPDALVALGELPEAAAAGAPRAVERTTLDAWRNRAASLAAIEGLDGTNLTLTGTGNAERIQATNVTPGFLALLGVTPAAGRSFAPDDAGRPVVVISHAFWRTRLAANPGAIGRQLVLSGQAHTVIGILPERFSFAFDAELWRPLPARGGRVLAVGRLARGVSPAHLANALNEVSGASTPPARVVAVPMGVARAGVAAQPLGILAAAAALAVVIAFANLAGLLLVRSIDRQRELAVRTALGARRSQLARQLLLETTALVALGLAGGVLLALWLTPVVGRLALEQFGPALLRDVAVSWRVIAVVTIAASAGAAACGLLVPLLTARRNVVDALRQGTTAAPRELLIRRVLVSGEVALAFVLIASMTLLGRSLLAILSVNPGFEAAGVLTTGISLPAALYGDDGRVAAFYDELENGVDARLGAGSMSIVDELPLTHDRGRRPVGLRPADARSEAVVRAAGTHYFSVMRIPIAAGRAFDRSDDASAPPRAVVSERLARRLFPNQSAIGLEIWMAGADRPVEIVGVAGDVTHRALDEIPLDTLYLPARQVPSRSNRVVVRSGRSDADVIAAIRDAVAQMDRELPAYGTQPMQEIVSASPGVAVRRTLTGIFMGFGLLAVALGAIGLFGVATHDVARRRAELALRMALGAGPMRILRATLAHSAVMVASGLMAGTLLSFWAARALGGMLSASARLDIVSVGLPAAALLIVAAVAVLPAARRAMRTDPLIALRSE
jgi:predicted permease